MKRIVLILIIVSCGIVTKAQNSIEGASFRERIITGGGLGLSFNSYQDFISLSPLIGYKITEKLIAGTSFTYRYTKYKQYSPSIKLIDYGVSPFLRYQIFGNFFVQTQYEYLNYEFPISYDESVRKDFNSFLAGGGFIQPIGDKAAFYVSLMYNFSYTEPAANQYSPYYSPFVLQAGITVGF